MNARMLENCHCSDCGWPVVSTLNNDGMGVKEPYANWDWWYYCSNKTCQNHEGEGVFQNSIEWVIRR